ncbi:hypothetical protein PUN28_008567 [Cardiocondyla obscurior]|uniref:Uncharacterized protein n=1 Tax=Cardiocondyla obscurior TaxID=286306 RepID=A0AAW2FZU4_9HYME
MSKSTYNEVYYLRLFFLFFLCLIITNKEIANCFRVHNVCAIAWPGLLLPYGYRLWSLARERDPENETH